MLFIRFAWLASLLAASSGFLTTPSSRRSLSGTCLNSKHKDSDRARMERMLEKSMGNDWRYFRAQLVAQEKAAEEANSKVKANSNTNVNAKKRAKPARRRRVVTNPERPLKSQRKVRPVTSSSPPVGRRSSRILLLDDKIGKPGDLAKEMMCLGAPAISAAPAKKIRRRRRRLSGSLGVKQGKLFFSDPFVSAAELPIHITSEGRTVDKHRWAYPVESIEVGCVLIANEKMRGDFKRAVVLVVNHGEKGTSGVVINRPIGTLQKITSENDSIIETAQKMAFKDSLVSYGGPFCPEEYAILHGFGHVEGSKKLTPGVFVGGASDLVNEVRAERFDPEKALFLKGYAVWTAEQMDLELDKDCWFMACVSSDFLLRYAGAPVTNDDNTDDLWSDILTCMGGEYADIARKHGKGDRKLGP